MKKTVLMLMMAIFFLANVALAAVNINTADQTDLATLPGIGEKKAEAIINYRKEHGNFKKTEDLLLVKGIGPKVLEKMVKEIEL